MVARLAAVTTGLMPSSVSAGELRTVPYRQCCADEVPCSMLRVRSSADTAICSKALWQGILAVAYLVEDALHEDHPHVDVPCNVGQELRDQRSEEHTSELQSLRHLVC